MPNGVDIQPHVIRGMGLSWQTEEDQMLRPHMLRSGLSELFVQLCAPVISTTVQLNICLLPQPLCNVAQGHVYSAFAWNKSCWSGVKCAVS